MSWAIREAGPEDCEALALVGAATFLDTFAGILDGAAIVAHCRREHSAEAYGVYLRSGASAWLVETIEGAAPIGYALLAAPALPGSETGDLELKRIYILSRFQGCGLGAALMHKAAGEAAQAGALRLLLGVYADNARALAFYRKQGFARIADRRFRVGNRDYDDVVLARMLG